MGKILTITFFLLAIFFNAIFFTGCITQDTNPSLLDAPSVTPSPQIIQTTPPDIQMTAVPTVSPNLSSDVVKKGDMVSIVLKIGDNKNNISINSYITLLAGQTTPKDYSSVFPGTSDQSPGTRIFALFSNQYNAISTGIVGMKPGEQKNISVHEKNNVETKTMDSEYLKMYKINPSNLSVGKLFVGTYSVPNSVLPPSTVLGRIVSVNPDYAVVDYSYPDIQVTVVQITNDSINTTPTSPVRTHTPVIQKVSPMFGPASGGTFVTITGTNLSSIRTINFGQSRTNSIRNVSDTTITAITFPSEPGVVSIFFEAPQWIGSYDGFTFTESQAKINTMEFGMGDYVGQAIGNISPGSGPAHMPQ